MRILLAVAALLGFVSSKTNLQDITGSWATNNGIVDPTFAYDYSLGYSTKFGSGKNAVNTNIIYESYEINV